MRYDSANSELPREYTGRFLDALYQLHCRRAQPLNTDARGL